MAERECAACGLVRERYEYSKNQWSKGRGLSRCIDCVQDGNFMQPESEDDDIYRDCAACYSSKPSAEYTSNQWSKGDGNSRCPDCVRASLHRTADTETESESDASYISTDSAESLMYRVCAACCDNLDEDQYSNNQWSKGRGLSRCIDCVQDGNFMQPESEDDDIYRDCAACYSSKPSAEYSSNQWSKGEGNSRCPDCVRASLHRTADTETESESEASYMSTDSAESLMYRVCAACCDNLDEDQYSNNQWRKGKGKSRCMMCVQTGRMPGSSSTRRACSACEHNFGKSDFSITQWKKGVGFSRCPNCIRENHFTRSEARSAARNNISNK